MYELQGMHLGMYTIYALCNLKHTNRRSSHQCTGYAKFVPMMHDLDDATVH